MLVFVQAPMLANDFLIEYNGDVFCLNRVGVTFDKRFVYYVNINNDFLFISSKRNNISYQWGNLVKNWYILVRKKWLFQDGFYGLFVEKIDWFLIFKKGL